VVMRGISARRVFRQTIKRLAYCKIRTLSRSEIGTCRRTNSKLLAYASRSPAFRKNSVCCIAKRDSALLATVRSKLISDAKPQRLPGERATAKTAINFCDNRIRDRRKIPEKRHSPVLDLAKLLLPLGVQETNHLRMQNCP